MADSKKRWRRLRLTLLVLVNCAAVGGGLWRFHYVNSPAYQWKCAVSAIRQQAWGTAEIFLKNLIAANLEDVDARLTLAEVYRKVAEKTQKTGIDPPQAVEQLIEVAKLRPNNTDIRVRLLHCYRETGQAEAAAQTASELAALGSTVPEVLTLTLETTLASENWDASAALIERLNSQTRGWSASNAAFAVRLHEGRGDTEQLGPILSLALREITRKSQLELNYYGEREVWTIGMLLGSAVRWAPNGDTATQRLKQSLDVLDHLALTPLGKANRSALVEMAAQWMATAKPASSAGREKRQAVCNQFLRLTEPVLEANSASPFAYEQLSLAAIDSTDPVKALSILRRGLEQHRQLPAERQRELLALHHQCAVRLLSDRRFAEAQANQDALLKNPETAAIGHLFATAVALEEGRFEDAGRHLNQAKEGGGDPIVLDTFRIRVHLALREWQAAVDLLYVIDQRWATLPEYQRRWMATMLGSREQCELLQAGCLLQLQEVQRAETVLQRLEAGSLQPQVRQMRVLRLLQAGQRSEAWEQLRIARRDAPDDGNLLLIQFGLLVDEKANDGATRLLTGHIRRVPNDLRIRLFLTQWLAQRGETALTLQQLAEIRQRFPDESAGWLLTADILLKEGRGVEVESLLLGMRDRPRVAHWVPLVQANRSLRQAGLTEAAEALQQANPELQRTAAFNITSAMTALARGESQQAFDLYSKSLHFSGARPQMREGFLRAFEDSLRTTKPETLGPQIEKLLEQFPNEPALLLAAAEMALRRGEFETARQRIDRLAEHDVAPGRPAYMRARLLTVMGKVDDALAQLSPMLEQVPDYPAARLLAAQLSHARGEHLAALAHLDALPKSTLDGLLPSFLRTSILMKLERPKDAEQVLIQLSRLNPTVPQTWLALSALQSSTAQTELAIKTLEDGLQRLPHQPDLQKSLLELLLRDKRIDQAASTARRFAGQTKDPAFSLGVARVFLNAEQPAAADEWLKLARQQSDKPSEDLLFLETEALSQQAASEKSDELFHQVRVNYGEILERNPQHIPAMNNLAWLLLRHFDEPTEALAVVEQLQVAIPIDRMTPAILDTVLEVYRRAGRQTEAQQIVIKSVLRFPNSGLLELQWAALLIEEAADDPEKQELVRSQLERARQHGLPPDRLKEVVSMLARLK